LYIDLKDTGGEDGSWNGTRSGPPRIAGLGTGDVELSGYTGLQGDRKVTQPIVKYLLMIAIQYNLIGLINTQCRCDYTRAHAGHVIL
jgi:hypothetical protein